MYVSDCVRIRGIWLQKGRQQKKKYREPTCARHESHACSLDTAKPRPPAYAACVSVYFRRVASRTHPRHNIRGRARERDRETQIEFLLSMSLRAGQMCMCVCVVPPSPSGGCACGVGASSRGGVCTGLCWGMSSRNARARAPWSKTGREHLLHGASTQDKHA